MAEIGKRITGFSEDYDVLGMDLYILHATTINTLKIQFQCHSTIP